MAFMDEVLAARLSCLQDHDEQDTEPCDPCMALLEMEASYLEQEEASRG